MTSKIAMILKMLDDGKWHKTEEMQLQLDLTSEEMMEVVAFLGIYGFATTDKPQSKIRINRNFKILAQNTT